METSRQGQTGFMEKMESRVPAGITKPVKMDKKTKDGCRRRPCAAKGGQYAAVAVSPKNVAEQSVTSPIPMSRVKTLTTTVFVPNRSRHFWVNVTKG